MKLFEVTSTTSENLQIATHKSVSTPNIVLICPFLFPIVFGINLMPLSILAQYSLSFVLVCAYLLGPLRGRNCSGLWALAAGLWCFTAVCHVKSLPLPPTPSQTEVYSTMEESVRPSSFYNPTMSANKHVVQICHFLLSAATDGLADNGSGERQTSPFNSDAQS